MDNPEIAGADAEAFDAASCEEPLIEPHAAAVELLETFRHLARGLSPKDRHMQEDLMQEMALATLQCAEPRSATAYCVVALWRAKSYLRLWTEQNRRPGCERHAREFFDPARVEAEQEVIAKAEAAAAKVRRAG